MVALCRWFNIFLNFKILNALPNFLFFRRDQSWNLQHLHLVCGAAISKPPLPTGVQVPVRIRPVSTVLSFTQLVDDFCAYFQLIHHSIHPFIHPSIFWILLQPAIYRSQDAVHSSVNCITEVCQSVNHRDKLILSVFSSRGWLHQDQGQTHSSYLSQKAHPMLFSLTMNKRVRRASMELGTMASSNKQNRTNKKLQTNQHSL